MASRRSMSSTAATIQAGIEFAATGERLETFAQDGKTDWGSFRERRKTAFLALHPDSHELLAQAICWASLYHEDLRPGSDRLQRVFLAVQAHQPPQYKLPSKVMEHARSADWPLVIKAASAEISAYRGPAFSEPEALAALIVQS